MTRCHLFNLCTPAGVRTLDTLIKSQVLYQLSYKRISRFAGAKVATLFCFAKLFSDFFENNDFFSVS